MTSRPTRAAARRRRRPDRRHRGGRLAAATDPRDRRHRTAPAAASGAGSARSPCRRCPARPGRRRDGRRSGPAPRPVAPRRHAAAGDPRGGSARHREDLRRPRAGQHARPLRQHRATFGWLGELYALAGGNLAQPLRPGDRGAGEQLRRRRRSSDHTAIVYIGSTYDEPLPVALLDDVSRTTAGDLDLRQHLAARRCHRQHAQRRLPGPVRLGPGDLVPRLDGHHDLGARTRARRSPASPLNAAGHLAPRLVDPAEGDRAGPGELHRRQRRRGGLRADRADQRHQPALGDAVGQPHLRRRDPVPLRDPDDRYLVFADLLFPALAPGAAPSGAARSSGIEDVDPTADPAELRQFADYLYSQKVPFSVGVVPEYRTRTASTTAARREDYTLAQPGRWCPR